MPQIMSVQNVLVSIVLSNQCLFSLKNLLIVKSHFSKVTNEQPKKLFLMKNTRKPNISGSNIPVCELISLFY